MGTQRLKRGIKKCRDSFFNLILKKRLIEGTNELH
jgi:hypothetical protein